MSDQQKYILIAGILLVVSGLGLYAYSLESRVGGSATRNPATLRELEASARNSLRQADEYLRQNSRQATAKAREIFTGLYTNERLPVEVHELARYGLAVALDKDGDHSAALEHLRALKTARLHDQRLSDKVDYSLGKILLFINHEAEGRSLLLGLLSRTNNRRLKSQIHTAFGVYYMRRGSARRARDNFRIALKYNPDNLQADYGYARSGRRGGGRGSRYDYYGDYLRGLSHLKPDRRRKVLSRLQGDAYARGLAAFRRSQYREALYYFRRLVKRGADPRTVEQAMFLMAESKLGLGDRKGAMRLFEKVLRNADSTMDQPALIKKGILLFQAGKLKRAAALFQKAERSYGQTMYTSRAREWRREAEAQIRDRSDFQRRDDEDTDPTRRKQTPPETDPKTHTDDPADKGKDKPTTNTKDKAIEKPKPRPGRGTAYFP